MSQRQAAKLSTPREGGPSYPLSHRVRRAVWNVVWAATASWTPPSAWRWRRFLLHTFGADVADECDVRGSARVWYPPNLKLGHRALIGPRVICYNMDLVTLGEYALVSQGAHLCSGNHDIHSQGFELFAKPIHIGAHAWVAADAFVAPGVTIGEGAVLGARGVAFSDLDPWTLYVGNPAKLRSRREKFRANLNSVSEQ